MDAIRLCFQKWVGGGLAGWFIRKYARRFANFCRDVRFEFLPCEQSWSLRTRGGASILEKWVDQRDLPTGNLFRQWFNALPKDEFHAVQVAVARQSAATVLRAVLLYRAVEVAQDSDLAYLKGSFQGWRAFTSWRIRIRVQEIGWLCVRVMRDLQHWELESAWRQWKFWMGVHRAEKVLRNFRMEQIRGATRQWVFNLWCSVCSAKIAAVAKAASDEEATMKEAVAMTVADAARRAACAAMVEAVAKATAVTRADRAMQMQWSSMAGELEEIQQYY